MQPITKREFILAQPAFPKETESDAYYLEQANQLLEVVSQCEFASEMPMALMHKISLTLIGYLQDIMADAGVWRSFVIANRELYNWSVPFHEIPEDYIDFELNREDVRFLTWYAVSMLDESRRTIYPHDKKLLECADRCFDYLESIYDDAPEPEGYNIAYGLDLNDVEDREQIYNLGQWLFMHCYLMTPAYAMTMQEIMSEQYASEEEMWKRVENGANEDTTGPLALFTFEWVYLMVKGKLLNKKEPQAAEPHKYYAAFTGYTGGKDIAYFADYESMNRFFIDALGWEEGEEHLTMAKGARDYVLMVNREKGMLMARDIAACIKDPENPLYDEAYAKDHAFELLSERGCCPGDLLHRVLSNGWLPDARFPGTDDTELVADNNDFIARCYLQLYYRGD